MKIFAKFERPNAGYDGGEYARSLLTVGKTYELEDASVGTFNSSVYLKNIDGNFNSVHFSFYDEDGNDVDIYKIQQFFNFISL